MRQGITLNTEGGGECLLELKLDLSIKLVSLSLICRDDWIRTSGLVVPNDARYRAALHPEWLFSAKILPKRNILKYSYPLIQLVEQSTRQMATCLTEQHSNITTVRSQSRLAIKFLKWPVVNQSIKDCLKNDHAIVTAKSVWTLTVSFGFIDP